jgi:hypothetical protein
MRALPLAVLMIAVATAPALAAENPPRVDEVLVKISLKAANPNEMIKLLAAGPGQKSAGPLMPPGISGILGYPIDHSLLVKGSPQSVEEIQALVAVLDVRTESIGKDTQRVRLTLLHVAKEPLRSGLLAIPGSGTAEWRDGALVLEGNPTWIWVAMRTAASLEVQPHGIAK